jgi:DNA-binding MarR family transcriptional regulator
MTANTNRRLDPNIGILFREPYLAFSAELVRRLRASGHEQLNVSHLVVFQHIDPTGSRLTELAARAQMTKPSMAYLVHHLEEAGYLRRVPDTDDGRARVIELTGRGWEQIEDALDVIADLEAELAAVIGVDRMVTLRDLLTQTAQATSAWRAT